MAAPVHSCRRPQHSTAHLAVAHVALKEEGGIIVLVTVGEVQNHPYTYFLQPSHTKEGTGCLEHVALIQHGCCSVIAAAGIRRSTHDKCVLAQ
jgi:hypothetical protein